jgi:hypothetical protein
MVIEDFDRATSIACDPPSETYARVASAIWSVMAAGGFEPTFGRQLQQTLVGIGLADVQVVGTVECIRGDAQRGVPQWGLLLDQLESHVLAAGAVSADDLEAFRAILRDPAVSLFGPVLARAGGRRRA